MDDRYDFPVTPEYPLEDIRRVQARLLEMGRITGDILEEAGIQYSLAMGSLIGALRHKGFVPWDDDLDFWVENERYDEALELLREKLPDDLIVHDEKNDPIYWPKFSRVRDLKSETFYKQYTNDSHYKYRGICLDLYRLYVVDESELAEFWLRYRYDNIFAKFERGILSADDVDKYIAWVDGMYQRWFVYYDRRFHGKVVTDTFGWELGEAESFFPLVEAEFEDTAFPIPTGAAAMLDSRFQEMDWRTPPPYEERLVHYSRVEFF